MGLPHRAHMLACAMKTMYESTNNYIYSKEYLQAEGMLVMLMS